MSNHARTLFEILRTELQAIDPSILELAEPKSVSYHGPAFFLEVLPRKQRLSLLLPLDHAEIEDPHGLAKNATEWKFLVNAKHEGGVLLRVDSQEDVMNALPIIRQAFAKASAGTTSRACSVTGFRGPG